MLVGIIYDCTHYFLIFDEKWRKGGWKEREGELGKICKLCDAQYQGLMMKHG
jgi:hypothetical protein